MESSKLGLGTWARGRLLLVRLKAEGRGLTVAPGGLSYPGPCSIHHLALGQLHCGCAVPTWGQMRGAAG